MEKTEAELDALVDKFAHAAIAQSTRASYRSQINSFVSFCNNFGYTAIPASTLTLCRYVAFLSSRLKCTSISQYMNVVRLLHVHHGYPNPLHNNIRLSAVLKGVQRVMGCPVTRKSPITVDILQCIRKQLDLNVIQHASFWASCLIAFYGMLRKSSLFPPTDSYLRIRNVKVYKWGIVLLLTYSKTIQCRQRQHSVPLPCNPLTCLCHARALLYSWKMASCSSSTDPMLPVVNSHGLIYLNRAAFDTTLKSIMLCLGLVGYSGHSFRRGGASHALHCGVPAEVNMAQGASVSFISHMYK